MSWRLPAFVIAFLFAVMGEAIAFPEHGVGATSYSAPDRSRIVTRYNGEAAPKGSVSLAGVVPELASLGRRLVSECGSKIISAKRHTTIRGTGRLSLHASGRAIDVSDNPSCIYRLTANWPGGVTTDYHRVSPNHVHISLGGFEHGKRFAHYGSRKRVRVAGRR